MSKKSSSNTSNKDSKDANRRLPAVPTNPVDALIQGKHAGSSADKARLTANTTGVEGGHGSSQSPSLSA